MIVALRPAQTVPEWALAYEFDIVLSGRDATPIDEDH